MIVVNVIGHSDKILQMLYNSSLAPGMDMANNAEEENCIFETDMTHLNCHHTQPFLRPFFRDNPGEPVPEENFMVQGKIYSFEYFVFVLFALSC